MRLEWSQYYQGMIEGTEMGLTPDENDWRYGGHLDALVRVDLSRWGLWDGLSATVQGYHDYGESVNGFDGTAFPINSALFFPDVQDTDGAALVAMYASQNFDDRWTVSVGKFNNIEGIRYRPIAGGGGVDTFWNLNPAVTSSGLVPAGIYAAQVSLKTDPVSYFLQLYDPVDAMNKPLFSGMFENGVGINGSATLKTSIGGRTGYYGISGSYSTSELIDLSDLLTVSAEGDAVAIKENLTPKSGAWAVAATMQQYLYQDPSDPDRGWGIFGALTLSDGNPTLFRLSYMLGVGGNSFLPGREDDRFGIAFSRFGISDDWKEAAEQVGQTVNDEYSVEAFYNFAVTPWFRITADVQWVAPGDGDYPDGVFGGLSTYVKF